MGCGGTGNTSKGGWGTACSEGAMCGSRWWAGGRQAPLRPQPPEQAAHLGAAAAGGVQADLLLMVVVQLLGDLQAALVALEQRVDHLEN